MRNHLGHIGKEWALATASPCRPQIFPAGTLLVPLSSASPRRIDPLWGLCPPLPPAAAPPFLVLRRRGFLKRALAPSPAGAKWREEWRAICLQIVRRYRNRPEGGMPATEHYAMAYTVESHPCPARRRRGKRALLGGLCGAIVVKWALRARKSRFWRLGVWELSPTPIACAVGQNWGLSGAVTVGGCAWP
ncbi:hypothetical protein [Acidithiobacillus thiooxidans]|uniref:hypothetical protein n=1 Tax=Acidithiobacillus thiooxidans TaxID=930 RepID=UPI001111B825|nr:hypothetical protein [Acidithiobacillus thiooxidans]